MPASMVLTLSDPYEYQRSVNAGSFDLVVTAAGPYLGKLERLELHSLWMQRSWQRLPHLARASPTANRAPIAFLVGNDHPPSVFGSELRPGRIAVLPMGEEHYHRMPNDSCWAVMSLPLDDLVEAGRIFTGRVVEHPSGLRTIQPSAPLMTRLSMLHKAACDLAASAPDIFAQAEVAKALEHALTTAMVACLWEREATEPTRPHPGMTSIMRRFENFIEENLDSPLYLMEICKEIGVSARTLRLHCQDHLGMGPQRYLWLRRMTLARRLLMRGEPGATTVTRVAMGCGFGELGRFAVQYHTLFGEAPSETLRRPVG